jgi:hypothetical protein
MKNDYIIVNTNLESDYYALFWRHEEDFPEVTETSGWQDDIEKAAVFDSSELHDIRLPVDGEWVKISLAQACVRNGRLSCCIPRGCEPRPAPRP